MHPFSSYLAFPGSALLPVSLDKRAQAEVILLTGGAAFEMRSNPRDRFVRLSTGDLELDESIESLEALVTAHLSIGRTEQAANQAVLGPSLVRHPMAPFSLLERAASPVASSLRRSLRRASWRVLYKAPRVVPSRSAKTSIGTSLRASATSTSRWCRVSSASIAWATRSSRSLRSAGTSGDAP